MKRNGHPAALRRLVSWKFALPASITRSSGPRSGGQRGQLVIDGGPCGHHQDDRARRPGRGDQIRQRLGRGDTGRKIPGSGVKIARDLRRAVPDRDGKALVRDVQRQSRPHRSKTDQPDLRHRHAHSAPLLFTIT
jgi:hypothetical protein